MVRVRESADRRSTLQARFGERLRGLRRKRDLTQVQLAKIAGLSYKYIGEVERGGGNPTLLTMLSLADALECELTDLLVFSARHSSRRGQG